VPLQDLNKDSVIIIMFASAIATCFWPPLIPRGGIDTDVKHSDFQDWMYFELHAGRASTWASA
jgi:hypothetical protein